MQLRIALHLFSKSDIYRKRELGDKSASHAFRASLFVGMKSNIYTIPVRFVGAEGRGRTRGRLTLPKLTS